MSVWFSLQLIYFAFGTSLVVSQYLGLNSRWLFYPLQFQAVLKKGLSNDASFCFIKNLEEQLQRSMKCLTTASDGRVWDWNIQNGLESGMASLSPEGDRKKGTGLSGRYPKLCCNLVLVVASFGGRNRGPSDPVLLQVYLLPKQFYDHIGEARLICRIRHCWKFGTRWPWQWQCPCCTACDSSRIHCRALHVGVQCILSGLCLTLYRRDLDISSL